MKAAAFSVTSEWKEKELQLAHVQKMSIISDKLHCCQSDTLHATEPLSRLAWPLAHVSSAQHASKGGPAVSAVWRRFAGKSARWKIRADCERHHSEGDVHRAAEAAILLPHLPLTPLTPLCSLLASISYLAPGWKRAKRSLMFPSLRLCGGW